MTRPDGNVRSGIMTTRRVRLAIAIAMLIALPLLSGCTVIGAGVGALFGQAAGGNTQSTVAGAAVGAMIGAQFDSAHARYGYHYGHQAYACACSY
jgi:uncharacterized protein YcfJ